MENFTIPANTVVHSAWARERSPVGSCAPAWRCAQPSMAAHTTAGVAGISVSIVMRTLTPRPLP